MTHYVCFGRGPKARYNTFSVDKKLDLIYFAEDTNEILMKDMSFGFNPEEVEAFKSVTQPTIGTLAFVKLDGTTQNIVIPVATTASTGLMDANDKQVTAEFTGVTISITMPSDEGSDSKLMSEKLVKATFATKQELQEAVSSIYKFKGTVTDFEDLPTTDLTIGDVYDVENEFELNGKTYSAGTDVAWNGTGWNPLGGHHDYYSKAESDERYLIKTPVSEEQLFENDFNVLLGKALKAKNASEEFDIVKTREGGTFRMSMYDYYKNNIPAGAKVSKLIVSDPGYWFPWGSGGNSIGIRTLFWLYTGGNVSDGSSNECRLNKDGSPANYEGLVDWDFYQSESYELVASTIGEYNYVGTKDWHDEHANWENTGNPIGGYTDEKIESTLAPFSIEYIIPTGVVFGGVNASTTIKHDGSTQRNIPVRIKEFDGTISEDSIAYKSEINEIKQVLVWIESQLP